MVRRTNQQSSKRVRREYPEEFKGEAVQMLLDGHMLYRWKKEQLARSGPAASSLEARVRELENELRRVEREWKVPKRTLATCGRNE